VSVRPIAIPQASSPLHDRPSARRLLDLDWFLLIATLLLIGYGLVMGYSITVEDRTFTGDVVQQLMRSILYAVIGLSVMAIVALVDHKWLGAFAPAFYVGTLGLLAVVLVIGSSTLGATRWVTIAGFKFQPSEFAKVFMVIVLAKWFADRNVRSPLTLIGALVVLAVPVALVFKQPDLGTSLVFLGMFFGMAFVAGARLWHLATTSARGSPSSSTPTAIRRERAGTSSSRSSRSGRGPSPGRGSPPVPSRRSGTCRSRSPTSCSRASPRISGSSEP